VGAPPPHPTWLTKDDLPRHIGQPHKIFLYVGSNLRSLSFVFLSLCNYKKKVLATFFVMCQVATKPQLLFLSWVFGSHAPLASYFALDLIVKFHSLRTLETMHEMGPKAPFFLHLVTSPWPITTTESTNSVHFPKIEVYTPKREL
jgi:hypothetical protein